MSENWRQSEICIGIYDKSQGSATKHLSWDGSLHYKFIVRYAGETIFKNRCNIWQRYRQNG